MALNHVDVGIATDIPLFFDIGSPYDPLVRPEISGSDYVDIIKDGEKESEDELVLDKVLEALVHVEHALGLRGADDLGDLVVALLIDQLADGRVGKHDLDRGYASHIGPDRGQELLADDGLEVEDHCLADQVSRALGQEVEDAVIRLVVDRDMKLVAHFDEKEQQ